MTIRKVGAGTTMLTKPIGLKHQFEVLNGTLQIGADDTFSSDSTLTIAVGATLDMQGHKTSLSNLSGGGDIRNAGEMFLSGGPADCTFAGSISGPGGFNAGGAMDLTLSGSNGFHELVWSGRRLVLNNDNAAGAGPISFVSFDSNVEPELTSDINLVLNNDLVLYAPIRVRPPDGGSITLHGNIGRLDSNSGTDINKDGTGTLVMNGDKSNDYSGVTRVLQGRLELGKSSGIAIPHAVVVGDGAGTDLLTLLGPEQIADDALMTLNGGIFQTNDFSETLGKLFLASNSTIDLAGGDGGLLSFADSSDTAWNTSATLTVTNWSESHHVSFGTDDTALTSDQLAGIRFIDPAGFAPGVYPAGFSAFSNGEIVPVPEPVSLILLPIAYAFLSRRRRR